MKAKDIIWKDAGSGMQTGFIEKVKLFSVGKRVIKSQGSDEPPIKLSSDLPGLKATYYDTIDAAKTQAQKLALGYAKYLLDM